MRRPPDSKSVSDDIESMEKEGAATFEEQVKEGVTDPYPYDRLMIRLRKEKLYAEELRVINRAIKVFTDQLKNLQKDMLKGNRKKAKISELSDRISRQMGLTDKQGHPTHVPEPIARWTKRKTVVEKRLAATKKRNTSGR